MNRHFALTLALLALLLTPVAGFAADTAADKMAEPTAKAAPSKVIQALPRAFFVDLKDGATVTSPVTIKFGVEGVEIAPAGTDKPNTGHFHLLIDTDMTSDQQKVAMPSDEHHLHYGKGQTEASVTLTPGKHTLQLVVADGKHVPLNPPVQSDKINVTVK